MAEAGWAAHVAAWEAAEWVGRVAATVVPECGAEAAWRRAAGWRDKAEHQALPTEGSLELANQGP